MADPNPNNILIDKRNGSAVVTRNRQREMNALGRGMRKELDEAFQQLDQDEEVRAVVITGGDYVFCAGMDIKEMSALPDEAIAPYFEAVNNCLKRIYTFRKPVVAAVGGIALGGGFNLATVCDMVVASESAIFGHPELKFGLNPFSAPCATW
jgi:enoyl-CoA hydratase/carnithine racemase